MSAAEAYERWCRVLARERLPAAMVDLDAVDRNIATLKGALEGSTTGPTPLTLRPATKSIRHLGLLKYIQAAGARTFRGWMTFSAHECTFLASEGLDDFLMGYPVGRVDEARALADLANREVLARATVDAPSQVTLLGEAARAVGVTVPVCIDVDCSWRPMGGRLHLGVRRSPVRSVDAALALARFIADTPGVRLDALLTYEAQVAGIQDDSRGGPLSAAVDAVTRVIKERSRPIVRQLRADIVGELRRDGHTIDVVNGGGTGSVRWTSQDPSVTEVTAGSGFVGPHTFDGFRGLDLSPALFFALSVVRRSDVDHVTCAAGGYVASGSPGADRLPSVYLPEGLTPLTALEGFGEVQTPLRVSAGHSAPSLGSPVLCRHAKGGELAERFNDYLMVRGDAIVERLPTYRGQGLAFM